MIRIADKLHEIPTPVTFREMTKQFMARNLWLIFIQTLSFEPNDDDDTFFPLWTEISLVWKSELIRLALFCNHM